jgi:hypothetical protein
MNLSQVKGQGRGESKKVSSSVSLIYSSSSKEITPPRVSLIYSSSSKEITPPPPAPAPAPTPAPPPPNTEGSDFTGADSADKASDAFIAELADFPHALRSAAAAALPIYY